MSGTREENVFMARVAEQAQRFEDMITYIRRVATMPTELNVDERNLLSVAYKNAVSERRKAWREVHAIELKESSSPEFTARIRAYREKLETELKGQCSDILGIIQNDLLAKSTNLEAQVFFLKMKGDYHRYLAEFTDGGEREKCTQDAHDAYEAASKAAVGLEATNPIRLGLSLNFSVFYYEVFGSPDKACELAKSAYEEAIAAIGKSGGSQDDDQYRDSAGILQLMGGFPVLTSC